MDTKEDVFMDEEVSPPGSVADEFARLNSLFPVVRPGEPDFYLHHGRSAAIENEMKNRYIDVLPVEKTLVPLVGACSAYINASFIYPLDDQAHGAKTFI